MCPDNAEERKKKKCTYLHINVLCAHTFGHAYVARRANRCGFVVKQAFLPALFYSRLFCSSFSSFFFLLSDCLLLQVYIQRGRVDACGPKENKRRKRNIWTLNYVSEEKKPSLYSRYSSDLFFPLHKMEISVYGFIPRKHGELVMAILALIEIIAMTSLLFFNWTCEREKGRTL